MTREDLRLNMNQVMKLYVELEESFDQPDANITNVKEYMFSEFLFNFHYAIESGEEL